MSDYLLTVDIGNTSTGFAVFQMDGLLKACGSFSTEIPVSTEELLAKLKTLLDLFQVKVSELKGLSLASVVPTVTSYWVKLGQRWLAREVLVANAETVPVQIDLRFPSEIGADRLVNAFAAWEKFKQSAIVVDYGTATTFDCISEDGVYLGGAIAPGIMMAAETLFRKTAKLPRIELSSPPDSAIGKDTESAMKSGILLGFACLTEGLIKELTREMGKTPLIIATGGLVSLVSPLCGFFKHIEPLLTLEGLYLLWKRCYG